MAWVWALPKWLDRNAHAIAACDCAQHELALQCSVAGSRDTKIKHSTRRKNKGKVGAGQGQTQSGSLAERGATEGRRSFACPDAFKHDHGA